MTPLTLENIDSALLTVEEALLSVEGPRKEQEFATPDVIAFGMYARSLSLYRGTRALLHIQLGVEALVLGRALFEESLRLQQLAAETKGDRHRLVIAWAQDSLKRERGLAADAVESGHADTEADFVASIDARYEKLARYLARHSLGPPKRFLSSEDAARRFSRTADLWTYNYAHQMVHGNDLAHLARRSAIKPGVTGFTLTTSDLGVLASIGVFCAESVIRAHQAAAQVFGWDDDLDTERLLHEVRGVEE